MGVQLPLRETAPHNATDATIQEAEAVLASGLVGAQLVGPEAWLLNSIDAKPILGLYGDCCIAAAPSFIACAKGAEELRGGVAGVRDLLAEW